MAVFRVEKSRDYTTMSNFHLREKKMSLKAKGLLSLILSLPDDWNYSISGLSAICKESRDGISAALKELEAFGYLVRRQVRGERGKFLDTEYVIFERPTGRDPDMPLTASPVTDFPDTVKPDAGSPDPEKPIQINTNRQNTEKQNKEGQKSIRGPCGLYGNVVLSDEEFSSLQRQFPTEWPERIERLSEYMANTGKEYKSHYLTILSWARRDRVKAEKGRSRTGFEDYSCKEGESY